jgi:signal transduction histidine kinase
MAPTDQFAAIQAELDAARAELQEFTYSVAHDLRADVRHILAYAQIALEDGGQHLPLAVAQHLSTISGSARHMGRLIDAMAELARVGSAPLQHASVPLAELAREIGEGLQREHPQRAIELRVSADLPVLRADPALLRLALHELLANAVKFTAARSTAIIEVGAPVVDAADAAGPIRQFFVRDNGVGFPAEQAARVFRVFQRLHGSVEFDGIGLGLALVRKIAQRHGARIEASGQPGQGCCITVTWPV